MPFDGLRNIDDPGIGAVPRWHKPRDVRAAAGLLLLMLGIGWLGGYLLALALLNEAVLAFLGIGP